jgi:hypothetical protein
MTEHPTEGGSYVRRPDGTLERVEFTRPADAPPEPAATEPVTPAAAPSDGSKTKQKDR